MPVWKDHHTLPTSSPLEGSEPSESVMGEWEEFVKKYPGKEHDPELQNTAIFIEGGTGKLIGDYVKRNLWHPER